jgi:hypothetical protein
VRQNDVWALNWPYAGYASILVFHRCRAMLRIPQLDDSAYTDSRRNAILTLEYFGTVAASGECP